MGAEQVKAGQSRAGKQLLDTLPNNLIPALLEFADHVADLDVDYVVFMARKAVRLHDLLIAAGCRVPKAVVITDHVLDQSLKILAGKSCALVDDTLIVGTTLADAEARLKSAGVSRIDKVVFAIDVDNWCEPLCEDVRYFARLDERQMLNFCAVEVEALANAGIPYLTDFPVSKRFRLSRRELATIHSLAGWDSYALTTETQEHSEVHYFTHLPTASYVENLSETIGELWSIVEIAKVRSFIFSAQTGHLARLIPIVTLKPLPEARVDQLFAALLNEIDVLGPGQCIALRDHLTTSISRLRFLQYFLGLIVGEDFLQSLAQAAGMERPIAFDRKEAVRLFGPWLGIEIDALHSAARLIAREGGGPNVPRSAAKPSKLPTEVVERGRIDLETLFAKRKASSGELAAPENLFSDLVNIFVELRTQYELPARDEVRRLGAGYHDATRENAPNRDRLKMGVPWGTIASFLTKRAGLNLNPRRSTSLSLMLDALIDIGIAVPIIAARDGILFRAYRHGEDALFYEQEYALAYHVVEGFLEGSGRDTVPRLTMEKLLVALLRVGVSEKFLTPHFGLGGGERIARIAFHRHGAVVSVAQRGSVFADDLDSWLTRRLVDLGVLRREGEYYTLGALPEAGYTQAAAASEANRLGFMFGILNTPDEKGRTALNQQDMAILTTCPQARDATGAVLAELQLFDRWFRLNAERLERTNLGSVRNVETALSDLVRSGGYHAFNSALFKLTGYLEDRAREIVANCAGALASRGREGKFVSSAWESMWGPIVGVELANQREKFEQALGRLAQHILVLAIGMFGIELALSSRALEGQRRKPQEHWATCEKILRYLNALAAKLPADVRTERFNRLHQRAEAREAVPEPDRAFHFAIGLIRNQLPGARRDAAAIDEEVRRHARLVRSGSFQFALWFDVIDASGRRRGLADAVLDEHMRKIEKFRRSVDDTLRWSMRDAKRQGARVVVVPSNLEAKEDEKHVLFTGKESLTRLVDASQTILATAQQYELKLRMLLLPADFAGIAPYEYHGDPSIQGDDFWLYGNELRAQLRLQQPPLVPDHSLLWLGEDLATALVKFPRLRWAKDPRMQEVDLVVDDRALRVSLRGGQIRFARR